MRQTTSQEGIDFGKLAMLCVGLAFFYLITAIYMSGGQELVKQTQWPINKAFGPIETTKDNQIIEIAIRPPLKSESWVSITSELLSSPTGPVMTGFGGEVYHATGVDDEGLWEEKQDVVEQRLVIPKPGRYYLRLKGVGNRNGQTRADPSFVRDASLEITIRQLRGGDRGFNMGVLVLVILGVALSWIADAKAKEEAH
ncbi:hypothetical protein [Magnetococcus sp. PR-3]|uniref:hypothetical protein n=1 Tax=Magnetococcus sp. PR-3 TaxID=3120355 RepID=UPI002FCE07A5